MQQNGKTIRQNHAFFHLSFYLLALTFLFASFSSPVAAVNETTTLKTSQTGTRFVYPIGKTVGIKLFSDGVLVIDTSDIKTEGGNASPAKECGLKQGDIITHINSQEVNSIEDVQDILQETAGSPIKMQVLRDERTSSITTTACLSTSDGSYKLGAWIRDSMAGIGTMTFYDPQSNVFGTLGHAINDIDTAQIMPLESGAIMPSTVTKVTKGLSGNPGQLHGSFEVQQDLGELYANTVGGVFGRLTDDDIINQASLLPVGMSNEIIEGPATILSNVTGDAVEEYEINIMKVMHDSKDTRHLMIQVTDKKLLDLTGGIVQGMSGSPILQNGKLIGAVTHVLLDDPKCGYGIFAEEMLTLAESNK